jgi:hypothetical protein
MAASRHPHPRVKRYRSVVATVSLVPTIIVRVQLTDEEAATYADLWEKMAEAGFDRTITSSKNVLYRLPHGMYRHDADPGVEVNEVLSKATKAVRAAGARGRVLAVHATRTVWSNLERDDEAWEAEIEEWLLGS